MINRYDRPRGLSFDDFVKLMMIFMILLLLTCTVVHGVDAATAGVHSDRGLVLGHKHYAAYTTFDGFTDSNGRAHTTITHHPPRWCLEIRAHGQTRETQDIGEVNYRALQDAQHVRVQHRLGGFFGTANAFVDAVLDPDQSPTGEW